MLNSYGKSFLSTCYLMILNEKDIRVLDTG